MTIICCLLLFKVQQPFNLLMAPKNPISGTCSKDSRLLVLEGTGGGGTGLANDDLSDDKEAVSCC
jgi:hypothetical protein